MALRAHELFISIQTLQTNGHTYSRAAEFYQYRFLFCRYILYWTRLLICPEQEAEVFEGQLQVA